MAQPSNWGTRAFLYLFIFVGIIAIGFGFWNLFRSLQCTAWPTTDGVVVASEMQSHSGENGDTYSAKVSYQFAVAGSNYKSDRLAFGAMSSSADYASSILKRYPVGEKVTVHYSPTDAQQSVLEPGVHGGTWVCFGVGTAFVLAAILFLQTLSAAAKAQMPGAPPSSVQVQSDGSITMDKPPVLMGVIFLAVGIGLCFVPSGSGKPGWLMYAIGGFFGLCGVFMLSLQLKDKSYSKLALIPAVVIFLAIFHWFSFGAGDRTGTATTAFSVSHFVSVRTPFAIFTIVIDLIFLASFIHWLFRQFRK